MQYSILIPNWNGDLADKGAGDLLGTASSAYAFSPLGSGYSDAYRGQRAPTTAELIQNLIGTAYACADINASVVAANPLRLFVKTGKGQQKTRWRTSKPTRKQLRHVKNAGQVQDDDGVEEITDPEHPLLKLLAKPTQDPNGVGSYDLRYLTQLFLDSAGRAYWYTPKSNRLGVPAEIWLLRPHAVQEMPDYSGSTIIKEYRYGRDTLPPDEVIRFHNPDPYAIYYGGYSPMAAAIEKIRIGRKLDAHASALLDNMGRPDAMLLPKGDTEGGTIGESEARRLASTFKQQFRMAGRGGVMVSEFPGSLEVLGWKPMDIVEIERERQIKIDVANCFGVPDAILERNAANLASATTAKSAHAEYAINPRCCRIAEVLNSRLVSLFDPTGRTFLAYDNPVPDDEVFELECTQAGGTLGLQTVDEGRTALGLPPLGGPAGDMRYINGTPIGADGKPILPPPPPGSAKPQARKPAKAAKMMAQAAKALSVAATRLAEATKEKHATVSGEALRVSDVHEGRIGRNPDAADGNGSTNPNTGDAGASGVHRAALPADAVRQLGSAAGDSPSDGAVESLDDAADVLALLKAYTEEKHEHCTDTQVDHRDCAADAVAVCDSGVVAGVEADQSGVHDEAPAVQEVAHEPATEAKAVEDDSVESTEAEATDSAISSGTGDVPERHGEPQDSTPNAEGVTLGNPADGQVDNGDDGLTEGGEAVDAQ